MKDSNDAIGWFYWGAIILCLFIGYQFGKGSLPNQIDHLRNENTFYRESLELLAKSDSNAKKILDKWDTKIEEQKAVEKIRMELADEAIDAR